MLGAVIMLLLAAGIEGFFRQLVHSVPLRWTLTGVTALFWLWYFGAVGRGRSDDVD